MNPHVCRKPSNFHHASCGRRGVASTIPWPQSFATAGVRYFTDHHTIHEALKRPVIRKAARHPKCNATHGTAAGARMAPTLAPELKIPVANDRARGGNHSAVALIAAGKLPLSPSPRRNRAI